MRIVESIKEKFHKVKQKLRKDLEKERGSNRRGLLKKPSEVYGYEKSLCQERTLAQVQIERGYRLSYEELWARRPTKKCRLSTVFCKNPIFLNWMGNQKYDGIQCVINFVLNGVIFALSPLRSGIRKSQTTSNCGTESHGFQFSGQPGCQR
jgi:hypothetical protein